MYQSDLSFAALLAGMVARWRSVALVAGGVVGVAVVLMLVVPPSYRVQASFVTTSPSLQLPRGLSDLAEGVGGGTGGGVADLAEQFGLGSSREPSESPAFYYQLLTSRELLTRVALSRFPDPRATVDADSVPLVNLLVRREPDPMRAIETAVKRLRRKMVITYEPRTNLVLMTVDAPWPALSADVANRAIELVSTFNREQRRSRAQARREFLESRVAAAQAELRAVEDSQRLFYERNRSWENSPSLLVGERRLRRQVETANSLYLSLRQEYERARIDEVNTTPVITVVDRAVAPRRREWPRPALILPTAALLGMMLGALWAAGSELLSHWARRHPDEADLLRKAAGGAARELRAAWSPGRARSSGDPGRPPATLPAPPRP